MCFIISIWTNRMFYLITYIYVIIIKAIQSITITDVNHKSFAPSVKGVYKCLSLSPVLCFINPINVLSIFISLRVWMNGIYQLISLLI